MAKKNSDLTRAEMVEMAGLNGAQKQTRMAQTSGAASETKEEISMDGDTGLTLVENEESETPEDGQRCGSELLKTVVSLTGLPETLVRRELERFLAKRGTDSKSITLDELRQVMLAYLDTVQQDLQNESESIRHNH